MASLDDMLLQGYKEPEPAKTRQPSRSADGVDKILLGEMTPFEPVRIGGEETQYKAIEKEGTPPGAGTHFRAGFVDDPIAKIRIYSEARFPKLKERERLKRYGIAPNGEIVYSGGR